MNVKNGFTLIELMIVVAVIAVLAAIALPNYQEFVLRNNAKAAEAKMMEIAQNLERHKSRNFSYRGYSPTTESSGTPVQYNMTLFATVKTDSDGKEVTRSLTDAGNGWVMKAEPVNIKNYTYLINSAGLRCRNKLAAKVTYTDCGGTANGSETW